MKKYTEHWNRYILDEENSMELIDYGNYSDMDYKEDQCHIMLDWSIEGNIEDFLSMTEYMQSKFIAINFWAIKYFDEKDSYSLNDIIALKR